MIDLLLIGLAFIAGLILGGLFFGGLWWTLQYSVSENSPTWLVSSSIIRMALLMLGLFFITSGDWKRALAALFGVMIARVFVTQYIRLQKTKIYADQ